jgi:general secretion pathway protein J
MKIFVGKRPKQGFTLLELLVVIAIFGVFAAMAYGGLNYVLKQRRSIETRLEETARWQKAFVRLRSDAQFFSPRPIRDSFGQVLPALQYQTFENRPEWSHAGWLNPLGQNRSDIERVAYRFEDQKLWRDSWRSLDRGNEAKPASLLLLDKVDRVAWRFLDVQNQWQTQWPPSLSTTGSAVTNSESSAPKAIEITLESETWGKVRWLFVTSIEALPPQAAGQTAGVAGTGAIPKPAEGTIR